MSDTRPIGARVRLQGAFEFPDGVLGTVTLPPDFVVAMDPKQWNGHRKTERRKNAIVTVYWVAFDQAAYTDEGEGPYRGAAIDAESLLDAG